MKLATIVIAYNPNLDELRQNIASYAGLSDIFILWDNSEKPFDLSNIKADYPNAVIHQDGINHGLPRAYNWAIKYAEEHGCTHLMTMDQDSRFERFHDYYQWVAKKGHNGISSCAINQDQPAKEEYTIINDSAQSSSIFPLSMIKELGPFREDLFISMVDAEMCLRAQEKGYKTLQYNGSNLIHHIGSGRKIHILNRTVTVSDYNALRHYYDSRNRILMWHEFPYDMKTRNKIKHLLGRLKIMAKILLFEDNKIEKITAIITGTWYGLLNKAKPYRT